MKKLLLLVGLVVFLAPSFNVTLAKSKLPKCSIKNDIVLTKEACFGKIIYGGKKSAAGAFKEGGGLGLYNLIEEKGDDWNLLDKEILGMVDEDMDILKTEYCEEYDGFVYIGCTSNGFVYKGEFNNGKMNGQGEMTYFFLKKSNKAKYDGEFKNNLRHGQGTYVSKCNKCKIKYIGEFKNGKMNGTGNLSLKDGKIIVGEWRNNQIVK